MGFLPISFLACFSPHVAVDTLVTEEAHMWSHARPDTAF